MSINFPASACKCFISVIAILLLRKRSIWNCRKTREIWLRSFDFAAGYPWFLAEGQLCT